MGKTKTLKSSNIDEIIDIAKAITRDGEWEVERPVRVSWHGFGFNIKLRKVND
jgi:hypothetical protein